MGVGWRSDDHYLNCCRVGTTHYCFAALKIIIKIFTTFSSLKVTLAWILKFLLDIAFTFYHLSILIFVIDFPSLNITSMTFVCRCVLVKWEPQG